MLIQVNLPFRIIRSPDGAYKESGVLGFRDTRKDNGYISRVKQFQISMEIKENKFFHLPLKRPLKTSRYIRLAHKKLH